MKHIKNIIALSLFAAMTAGCEDYNLSQYKDVPPVPKEGEKIDMVFTSENSSFSRTNIYEGDKISWSKDDMISVFAKQVNSMFTIDNLKEKLYLIIHILHYTHLMLMKKYQRQK